MRREAHVEKVVSILHQVEGNNLGSGNAESCAQIEHHSGTAVVLFEGVESAIIAETDDNGKTTFVANSDEVA